MKNIKSKDEVDFLKELSSDPLSEKIFTQLRISFDALQARSQMLLGLVTICLTITGFSGIKIAESGMLAKVCLFIGTLSTLITALLLISGPLKLQWLTQQRASTLEKTIEELIHRRNKRTKIYHLASACLIFGLGGYITSLAFYLLQN